MSNLALGSAVCRSCGSIVVASVSALLLFAGSSAVCFGQAAPSPTNPPAAPVPATPAPAADDAIPPIGTERPGYTNGTDIVPVHHIQFETGYQAAWLDGISLQHVLDASELRVPLSTDAEIRVNLPAYYFDATHGYEGTGFSDTGLSAKFRFLTEVPGKRPALAFILSSTFPSGGKALRADRTQPGLDLEAQMAVASVFQVQANLSATRNRGADQTYTQLTTALSLGYSLTPTISPFVQIEREAADNVLAPNATLVDAGVTYTLTPSLQLDASAGVGMSSEAYRYHFVGVGIAKRW